MREKLSLADVASRWVKWDDRKSNPHKGDYWAPCPFHDEKAASFHVDDSKSFYYCFGCHAKGDVISFFQDKQGISRADAVRQLAFIAGMDQELSATQQGKARLNTLDILQVKDLIVENFSQENFFEIGVITGWTAFIRGHNRLLRSLSWGDPDYPGHVLDLLTRMDEAKDGSLQKVGDYVSAKFSDAAQLMSDVAAYSAAKRSLGYSFEPPRNDIIAVMMPFGGGFESVYDAIKSACATTPLEAKRADEVWNHSVLINDILELINHSAVENGGEKLGHGSGGMELLRAA